MELKKISEFDIFCRKLGEKYRKDYYSICKNPDYNNSKTLNNKLSAQQYIQAASEQIYYYWLQRKLPTIDHDVKVNPPKDVDLYFDGFPYNLRIEIKTQEIDEMKNSYDPNTIEIKQDHRYDNDSLEKSKSYNSFHQTASTLAEDINLSTLITGKKAKEGKLNDLKLDTFLTSANSKMLLPDQKTINSLLICLDTFSMFEYMDFIINLDTGLFSSNPYIKETAYTNVDFVILSNCCEAHLDNKFKFNVWDASNYINFAIPLHPNVTPLEKMDYIATLFSEEFMSFYLKKDSDFDLLHKHILLLQFLEFIKKMHPCFVPNKNKRKY